jgi:hypothetical protein
MTHKIIKTEAAYQKTVKRTIAIFEAKEGTPEADELALLLLLVKDYEDKHMHVPAVNPIQKDNKTYPAPFHGAKEEGKGIENKIKKEMGLV